MLRASIRQRYRVLAARLHPDRCAHPQAKDAFQLLHAAQACLSDERARAEYDAQLDRGEGDLQRGHNAFASDAERTRNAGAAGDPLRDLTAWLQKQHRAVRVAVMAFIVVLTAALYVFAYQDALMAAGSTLVVFVWYECVLLLIGNDVLVNMWPIGVGPWLGYLVVLPLGAIVAVTVVRRFQRVTVLLSVGGVLASRLVGIVHAIVLTRLGWNALYVLVSAWLLSRGFAMLCEPTRVYLSEEAQKKDA